MLCDKEAIYAIKKLKTTQLFQKIFNQQLC